MDARTEGGVTVSGAHMRFNWRAVDRIATALGDGWQDRIDRLSDEPLHTVAVVLAAAVEDRDAPEAEPDWWMDQSPPVVETIHQIQDALMAAFFGPGGAAPRSPEPQAAISRLITSWLPSRSMAG